MANYGQRLRFDFSTGTVQSLVGNTLTFTSPTGLGTLPTAIVSGTNYMPLVINPSPYGSNNTVEIVWLYSYTNNSNTGQVARAQEGTTNGGTWSNVVYAHGPTVLDFGINNMMANGDFPVPTASGQVLKATGSGSSAALTFATSSVPASAITPGALASGVTISGNSVFGDLSAHASISGANVYGYLANATISGSQVVGYTQQYFAPTGLPGATAASRYVGGTTNGYPGSGNFAVGDYVVDQTGNIWICTVSGNPGTWEETSTDLTVDIVMGVYY